MKSYFDSQVVTAEEFSKIYPTVLKFTNASANHRGVNFKVGEISKDHIPLTLGECESGGIYFTDEENAHEWSTSYNSEIGQITRVFLARVPAGATVVVFDSKAKATHLEIIQELDYRETLKNATMNAAGNKAGRQEKRSFILRERRTLLKNVQFHRFLKPNTIYELKVVICLEKFYPIVEKLIERGGQDINDPSFDELYEALIACVMKSETKRLFLIPFFCPRLVHVALKRESLRHYENEELEAFELYPEFFSRQSYSSNLKKRLSYLQGTRDSLKIRKALGMI